jgi:hypothetical protein
VEFRTGNAELSPIDKVCELIELFCFDWFSRIIFYAIALLDEDQQRDVEDSSSLLKTRDGMQKLALYLSSVARYRLAFLVSSMVS